MSGAELDRIADDTDLAHRLDDIGVAMGVTGTGEPEVAELHLGPGRVTGWTSEVGPARA